MVLGIIAERLKQRAPPHRAVLITRRGQGFQGLPQFVEANGLCPRCRRFWLPPGVLHRRRAQWVVSKRQQLTNLPEGEAEILRSPDELKPGHRLL